MNMSENPFIQEARRRADLLIGSFNPGKAINWFSKPGNKQRLMNLLKETGKYMSGGSTQQEVGEFWCGLNSSPEIKSFISCLDSGAHVLSRRGSNGDVYSIPVLHYVTLHFIYYYL
ncbi:TPA: hypothetical protein MND73_004730 [Salmonella enterica subsp. houtenae]|nr:hypothetical protein [Salmonella enterica subsp. houtenae]